MSPLSHLNQSAGQSPLSDVERTSSHGGSTGGIPVEGFSGFNVVVSEISFVVVVAVVVVDDNFQPKGTFELLFFSIISDNFQPKGTFLQKRNFWQSLVYSHFEKVSSTNGHT